MQNKYRLRLPWTRAQKAAWDGGFSAADSRIPKRLNPHRESDPALARAWASGYDTAMGAVR
jgi:hypothetical protein